MVSSDFLRHQEETAERLGYATVDEMNREHDPLHRAITTWMRVPSMSLREAQGDTLSGPYQKMAWEEENMILAIQKYLQAARAAGYVPKVEGL